MTVHPGFPNWTFRYTSQFCTWDQKSNLDAEKDPPLTLTSVPQYSIVIQMPLHLGIPFQSPGPLLPIIPRNNSSSVLQVSVQKTPSKTGAPFWCLFCPIVITVALRATSNLSPKCSWEGCLPVKNSRFMRARFKSASHYHSWVGVGWRSLAPARMCSKVFRWYHH